MKNFKLYIPLLLLFVGIGACKKDFLEKKANTSLVLPTTLEDFQQILDLDYFSLTPGFGEIGSDDYYISSQETWQALPAAERNAHIWNKNIFEDLEDVTDWSVPYRQIFYANLVLEGLEKIPVTQSNTTTWNNIKGNALFLRAYAMYNLSQVFCPPYDKNSAENRFGLPLRLTSDINEVSIRSTVKQTYDRILGDLMLAKDIVPGDVSSTFRNRANIPAVLSLLARVYLSMRDYPSAEVFSNLSLLRYNKLLDYNNLPTTGNRPFIRLNDETVYQSYLNTNSTILLYLFFSPTQYAINPQLLSSYASNDLRKILFFRPTNALKLGYYNASAEFSGLACDEQYLIRAECLARKGNVEGAMADLNTLLKKRYINTLTSPYINRIATDADDALNQILIERRKELIFRGLRWSDLRRYNMEGKNITLTRNINSQMYSLPPNDTRWTYPIPPQVLNLSNIEQYPR